MHTCHTGQVRQYRGGALQQGADDDDGVKPVQEVPVEEKYVEKVKEAKNVTDRIKIV